MLANGDTCENHLRLTAYSTSPPARPAGTRRSTDPIPVAEVDGDESSSPRSVQLSASPPLFVGATSDRVPRTPLAAHAHNAMPDGTLSPRAEAKESPRKRLVESGRAKLKKMFMREQPVPVETRKRSATLDAVLSPRTPQQVVVGTSEHVVYEPVHPPSRDISDLLQTPINVLTTMRCDDTDSASSADTSTDSGQREKKKRHSMLLKATSGGSPRYGASGVLEFEGINQAPVMRVKSHSSIGELRRHLLQAESSSESDQRTASAPEADTGSDLRRLAVPAARVQQLVRSVSRSKLETYTLIEYNSSPLGLAHWQRFLVPNSQIDAHMRTALERATRSDQLDQPYRLCTCTSQCTLHPPPDADAKMAAVYVLDPNNHATTEKLRRVVSAFTKPHKSIGRGGWAIYRIVDGTRTNFEQTPCTYHYRFKIFV